MKKVLAVVGMLFGLTALGFAGTPQENLYSGQASFSNATIITSSFTTLGTQTVTLTVSTPTVINSGGSSYNGRNCFTKFIVQMSTYSVLTVKDNNTTVWTLYGAGLGTTGTNTITLPEDHLAPFCTTAGDQTSFVITPTSGLVGNPEAVEVEGYTTYGGTNNAGPMY